MKEYLTKDEIARLFDSVKGQRDKLLFTMGLAIGPRVSEIADIPLRNISSDRIKIHDIKKKCYRDVIVDSQTRAMIDRYLQTGWSERHRKGHWSKRNRKGQRADKHERLFYMSPKTINRVVKFWFEKAKIPSEKAHWHVFRHTYIYQSMEAGVPISHLVAQTGDSVEVLINDYGTPTIDSRIEIMEKRGRYWESKGIDQ